MFFFFFGGLGLWPQDAPRLVLAPERVEEGFEFTVSFVVPHPRPEDVGVEPEFRFPPAVELVRGPEISPAVLKNPVSGEWERLTRVSFLLRAVRPGRSVLGPVPFSLGTGDFLTASVLLECSRAQAPTASFDLVWRSSPGELYEGESSAVFLEMTNLEGISVPELVSSPRPGGALFEEVKGLGGITGYTVGERELFSMTVASWLLTPSSAGRVTLPASRVRAGGVTVTSAPYSINVRGLPPEVKTSGAVGKFTVDSRLQRGEISLGESVSLFFRVRGEGNLNYLQPPLVSCEGVLITSREVSASHLPFERGYRGSTEWEFRLSPQNAGDFTLTVPRFFWLDPESGEVSSAPAKDYRLRVLREEVSAGGGPPLGKPGVLFSRNLDSVEAWDLCDKPYLYGFLLPAGFFFVRGMRRARPKKNSRALFFSLAFRFPGGLVLGAVFTGVFLCGSSYAGAGDVTELERSECLALVDRGAEAYENGAYGEAREAFLLAREGLPTSPGIYHNLGLAADALGDRAFSIFYFRRAVMLNPSAALLRSRLAEAERAADITHAAAVPDFHPDLFFLLLAAFCAALAGMPWLVRGRHVLLVCVGFLLFGALLSGAGEVYQSSARLRPWGIAAKGGGEMRKIPRAESSNWLTLAEGTAVDIISRGEDFFLVRTGTGIEGWLERGELLTDDEGGVDAAKTRTEAEEKEA
ncbi:MAG: BatD family protein [Spirochaetales bacterium]|nr:BatD family protein [Spirochaetales bacterium]